MHSRYPFMPSCRLSRMHHSIDRFGVEGRGGRSKSGPGGRAAHTIHARRRLRQIWHASSIGCDAGPPLRPARSTPSSPKHDPSLSEGEGRACWMPRGVWLCPLLCPSNFVVVSQIRFSRPTPTSSSFGHRHNQPSTPAQSTQRPRERGAATHTRKRARSSSSTTPPALPFKP